MVTLLFTAKYSVNYLFSVDEPSYGRGREGVVACAVECHPVAKRVMVVAFIARDHRETFGQTYHGELASGLHKLERWRVHGNLTHKLARGGQFYFLQCDLVHARGYDLEKRQEEGKFLRLFVFTLVRTSASASAS